MPCRNNIWCNGVFCFDTDGDVSISSIKWRVHPNKMKNSVFLCPTNISGTSQQSSIASFFEKPSKVHGDLFWSDLLLICAVFHIWWRQFSSWNTSFYLTDLKLMLGIETFIFSEGYLSKTWCDKIVNSKCFCELDSSQSVEDNHETNQPNCSQYQKTGNTM